VKSPLEAAVLTCTIDELTRITSSPAVGFSMCDSIYHVIDPYISLTIYPVIAYDAIFGIRSLLRFMFRLKAAKKNSFSVQLSAAIIAFCSAAGVLYGLSQGSNSSTSYASITVFLILYLFPLADYILKKNRSVWDHIFRLPFALGVALVACVCVFATFCPESFHYTFD
jgi:hypothetical protein